MKSYNKWINSLRSIIQDTTTGGTGPCEAGDKWRAGNAVDTITVVTISELPVYFNLSPYIGYHARARARAVIKDAKLLIFPHTSKFLAIF